MSSGRSVRVLLVDDEPLVREGLREPLSSMDGVEVVGESGSGRAAVGAIRKLRPDIVFLDVRMPGLDGFGVLETLGPEERPVTVFVTAYDEYALEAFRAQAVDYLLKPFSPEQVRAALERARALLRGRALGVIEEHLGRALDARSPAATPVRRIAVRVGMRTVILDVDRIDYLEADGNHVQIHMGDAAYPVRDTLRALESELGGGSDFVRVHRSYLVRFDRVRELRPTGGERWEILLDGGARLPVSEAGRTRLTQRLEQARRG